MWQQWRDVRAVGVPCGSVLMQGQYTASCEACDGSRGRKGWSWTVCYDSASCSSPTSKVRNEEEAEGREVHSGRGGWVYLKKVDKNKIAPAGNQTRVCTVAGYYSTTRPLVLVMANFVSKK